MSVLTNLGLKMATATIASIVAATTVGGWDSIGPISQDAALNELVEAQIERGMRHEDRSYRMDGEDDIWYPDAFPRLLTDLVDVRRDSVDGMRVFVVTRSDKADSALGTGRHADAFPRMRQAGTSKAVMLVHGGSYAGQLDGIHLWFSALIARATGATVYVPAYPVSSDGYEVDRAYAPMQWLYRCLIGDGDGSDVIIIGDSAGGGFAMGLCEWAKEAGLAQPNRLVLMSPWADITNQPWDGLAEAAQAWAGDGRASQRKWQASPAFGDLSALERVIVFNGARDMLSNSIENLHYAMRGQNVDSTLITAGALGHDYVYVLPYQDSVTAFDLICACICESPLSPDGTSWLERAVVSADPDLSGSDISRNGFGIDRSTRSPQSIGNDVSAWL